MNGSRYKLLDKLVKIIKGTGIPNAEYPEDVIVNVCEILTILSFNEAIKKRMLSNEWEDSKGQIVPQRLIFYATPILKRNESLWAKSMNVL